MGRMNQRDHSRATNIRKHTMGSPAPGRGKSPGAVSAGKATIGPNRSSALEENVLAIKRWERAILLARSKAEQVSDWIACTAASGPVLVFHVVWFSAWGI